VRVVENRLVEDRVVDAEDDEADDQIATCSIQSPTAWRMSISPTSGSARVNMGPTVSRTDERAFVG
jgi:hypothetical protein